MHLQAARFAARVDPDGVLMLLADQDRALWDEMRVEQGLYHLEQASHADAFTRYHCEAGISAAHAASPSDGETDWSYIVAMYDALERIAPSPVVTLNRAVAIGKRDGPAAGLALAQELAEVPGLNGYRLLPVVLGRFCMDLGRPGEAARHYRAALRFSSSVPEQRLLESCLAEALAVPPERIVEY